jgi:transposase
VSRSQRSNRALSKRSSAIPNALVLLLIKGMETAQMLVHEVLLRNLRDRRAVACYAGLTGTPDESGSKRRDKGISKAGNPGAA